MMTKNQLPRAAIDPDKAIIRALSSITSEQADAIVQAVDHADPICGVQIFDDYNGYLSLLIEPTKKGNKQSAFSVTGTAQRLELWEAHGDNLIPLFSFGNVSDLVDRLIGLIRQ